MCKWKQLACLMISSLKLIYSRSQPQTTTTHLEQSHTMNTQTLKQALFIDNFGVRHAEELIEPNEVNLPQNAQ